jgi:hypothetical protein
VALDCRKTDPKRGAVAKLRKTSALDLLANSIAGIC